jgi:hypothetical protein
VFVDIRKKKKDNKQEEAGENGLRSKDVICIFGQIFLG